MIRISETTRTLPFYRPVPLTKLPLKSSLIASLAATLATLLHAAAQNPVTTAPIRKEGVVFALYTVQNGVMKMTAQLYPLAANAPQEVSLELNSDGKWKPVGKAKVVSPGWTAHFRIELRDVSKNVSYRLRYANSPAYEGLIRHDPVEKETIVAAVFTGNSPGPGGGKITKADVAQMVSKIDPDVLLFTGDQVYDHDHHTEHWIKFGEDFGNIIKDRPTVTIPDDHDVGGANLWGAGGRPAKVDTDGGYTKPADYMKMVHRAQTAHLPDPHDPAPVKQDIPVYFTSLNIGGIDFAIIEDRKWNTVPRIKAAETATDTLVIKL